VRRLLSSEHFSVDGRLMQVWASTKSFRRRRRAAARNPEPRLRGERLSASTHGPTNDSHALIYRKDPGIEARLCSSAMR
jgi:hypothetical protein